MLNNAHYETRGVQTCFRFLFSEARQKLYSLIHTLAIGQSAQTKILPN